MNWYRQVIQSLGCLPDALDYFNKELESARQECSIKGLIEKNLAALPGLVEQRYSQLQEIEAILEYLNIEYKRLKNTHFRKYLENYQRSLSSRDCDRFAEGEADVIAYEKIINEVALLRNQWLGITKGLDQKSFSLNNITKLRSVGIEDATIS